MSVLAFAVFIMTLYDLISGILTVTGYVVLVYRIVHLLESVKPKRERLERLCTKWLVFTIFLRIEDYLLVLLDILPLGKLILLFFKLFLFLPENSVLLFTCRSRTLSISVSISCLKGSS